MCRIAGIINPQLATEELRVCVQNMIDCMAHGGPDGEGIYMGSSLGVVFGHRRLSIIDLSESGAQPMTHDGLTITFNGEIFNYLELKSELQSLGHQFTSNSDTEVILIAYREWQTAAFHKLEGMFAFALFDQKLSKTYLVRDRAGIKPLYYTDSQGQLIFASEIKAFAHAPVASAENPDWKCYFLAFGSIPEPYTTLKDVCMLSKGTVLIWNHLDQSSTIIKMTEQHNPSIQHEEKALKTIKTKLEQATKSHLLADAPIGVYLSGGIDSSLLALLAHQQVKKQLRTVSINFQEAKFSEKAYQDLVVAQLSGQHQTYQIDEQEFLKYFDQAVQAIDQPTQDGINSWFVNKCAAENGLKAVLSGIGADELFGGYPSFKRISTAKILMHLPAAVLKVLSRLPGQKWGRFYYLSYRNTIGLYLFLRGAFTPIEINRLLKIPLVEIDQKLKSVPLINFEGLTSKELVSELELGYFMQNQLLKDTDFMSMAHGVEVRVPFLDQNVVSTTKTISSTIRFKSEFPKFLLVKSFVNLLPRAIWDRRKMGFSFPFQQWMRKVDGMVNPKNYDQAYAAGLIEKFAQNQLHWSKAFMLYQVFAKKQHDEAA